MTQPQLEIVPTMSPDRLPDLDTQEIMKLIPHRYPMLLVDRIVDIVPGQGATGIKNVTMNEWFFQGHFPNFPVMPGVLIIEAMAQTGAAFVVRTRDLDTGGGDKVTYFMSIEEAKFRKPVLPGDTLKLKVALLQNRGNIWKLKCEAWVGDTLTDEAILKAMIVDLKS
jgi:3-hydroxyacyl-[acyl-carrier-protein] dehydratase